jgi:tetratricopeptide (TPR) repeat protein
VRKLAEFDERKVFNAGSTLLVELLKQRSLTDEEMRNIGMLHTTPGGGDASFGFGVLQKYIQRHPSDVEATRRLATTADRLNRPELSVQYWKAVASLSPIDPSALERYAWTAFLAERAFANPLTGFDGSRFESLLTRSVELAPDTLDVYRSRLGEYYFRVQQYAKAAEQFTRVMDIRLRTHPKPESIPEEFLRLRMANTMYELGKLNSALEYAVQTTMINPRNQAARDLVSLIWSKIMLQQPAADSLRRGR